ncbi:pseudouridine synthase [Mycoplasma crocodyli]|uniref:Pseudouridine synthase n=1 Tax=Mycoplasma crocodyli (strain ATCC 51981 / MP145) TaxID=512564 RepID=D5E5N8_MYCCM|nr:pseudouridine synthase [Mycoplasma crocodyli]ADE19524.1 ribosomal large subunit pseudouridine synthase B [Mycoplasma crocodyli MP145]
MERIQKLLSQAGIASRRSSEELIKKGLVKINDKVALVGQKASFNDKITVNGKEILQEKKVYYILNKPAKYVCTNKDNFDRKKVIDLLPNDVRIFPVGRLDYDTTGVLLLTNDGELSNKLIHPSFKILRKYRARLDEPLSRQDLNELNKDQIINGKLSSQSVEQLDNKTYLVSLHQGTYHHVKELFSKVGRLVINLKRVEFAGLGVEKIPVGEFRSLTMKEIKSLHNLVKEVRKNEKE